MGYTFNVWIYMDEYYMEKQYRITDTVPTPRPRVF